MSDASSPVTQAPGYAVFIPAYNAAATLEQVIARIPAASWKRIEVLIVVDDGSTDATAEIAGRLEASHAALELRRHERNGGYGTAATTGLSRCLDSRCPYAVCLHADGQYPPELMDAFVDEMAARGLDILQGSRHRHGGARAGGMPVYKIAAGKALVWLENRVFGLRMSDYHSGFMCYSRRALASIPFGELSRSFDFDLEMIASARARGLSIDERGIPTHYGDERSHLNPMTYGLRVLRVLARFASGHYRAEGGARSG